MRKTGKRHDLRPALRILGLLALILLLCAGCAKKPGSGAPQPEAVSSAAELSSIEAELSSVEAELSSKEAELSSVEAELSSAEAELSSAEENLSSAEAASSAPEESGGQEPESEEELTVEKDGWYTSKEEVALYLHLYGRLPGNFISKRRAEELGWDASEGNLDEVAPGKSIGGSRFGNYEGRLPEGDYRECDINYAGGFRGPERIVYSDDGRIYYTADHYRTFEQLY